MSLSNADLTHLLLALVLLLVAAHGLGWLCTRLRQPRVAGEIVVQEDLLAELRTGRIGAAIDAATPDPLPDGHPLLAEPGLLYTPHVGGHTVHTLSRLYDLVGSQLRSYLRGAPLRHVVSLGGKATPRQP